ncbi:hypothetical protein NL676_033197 [Syzygium grande]|nr:hypothetical protein NL676_033197 [Syzygium grande]
MGMDALQVFLVSRAAADHRAGRAGRTGPGSRDRLYTESAYLDEMLPSPVPEIQRTNLGYVVLLLKSLKVENLLDFAFMDPPPQDNILNSTYQLWVLGALNNFGGLTEFGWKMVEFPLDPPLAKMLLMGDQLGCLDEGLWKAQEVRSQLLDILKMLRNPLTSSWPNTDVIRKAICSAYFHNAARLKGIGEYVNCRTRDALPFAPEQHSLWHGTHTRVRGLPRADFDSERVHAMCHRCGAAVVGQLGPMFFSIKDSDKSLLEHKKQEEEMTAMEEEMENLRRSQADAEIEIKAKEREKRVKQQQRCALFYHKGSACNT